MSRMQVHIARDERELKRIAPVMLELREGFDINGHHFAITEL